jgi:anti-sigma regulatory factor (Ser/Thr protein kinase)
MYDDMARFISDNKLPEKLANNFKLAVSEAFTNALVHGNQLNASKIVKISLSINKEEIVADIIDEGTGNPDDISKTGAPSFWHERGRGVILMESVADSVRFKQVASTGGLKVRLVFSRLKYDEKNINNTANTRPWR